MPPWAKEKRAGSLKRCGAPFEIEEVQLYGEGYREALVAVTPSGKVPVLSIDGETHRVMFG